MCTHFFRIHQLFLLYQRTFGAILCFSLSSFFLLIGCLGYLILCYVLIFQELPGGYNRSKVARRWKKIICVLGILCCNNSMLNSLKRWVQRRLKADVILLSIPLIHNLYLWSLPFLYIIFLLCKIFTWFSLSILYFFGLKAKHSCTQGRAQTNHNLINFYLHFLFLWRN